MINYEFLDILKKFLRFCLTNFKSLSCWSRDDPGTEREREREIYLPLKTISITQKEKYNKA